MSAAQQNTSNPSKDLSPSALEITIAAIVVTAAGAFLLVPMQYKLVPSCNGESELDPLYDSDCLARNRAGLASVHDPMMQWTYRVLVWMVLLGGLLAAVRLFEWARVYLVEHREAQYRRRERKKLGL